MEDRGFVSTRNVLFQSPQDHEVAASSLGQMSMRRQSLSYVALQKKLQQREGGADSSVGRSRAMSLSAVSAVRDSGRFQPRGGSIAEDAVQEEGAYVGEEEEGDYAGEEEEGDYAGDDQPG